MQTEEFAEYMRYTRSLRFDETPDYDYLRGLFEKVLRENGWQNDGKYDWSDLVVWCKSPAFPSFMQPAAFPPCFSLLSAYLLFPSPSLPPSCFFTFTLNRHARRTTRTHAYAHTDTHRHARGARYIHTLTHAHLHTTIAILNTQLSSTVPSSESSLRQDQRAPEVCSVCLVEKNRKKRE